MKPYKNLKRLVYYSDRYNKVAVCPYGYWSDGATFAVDVKGPWPVQVGPDTYYKSRAWLVHDVLCEFGCWEDGTEVTNFQASMVLHDILADEGRWWRSKGWFVATFLFGGNNLRKW